MVGEEVAIARSVLSMHWTCGRHTEFAENFLRKRRAGDCAEVKPAGVEILWKKIGPIIEQIICLRSIVGLLAQYFLLALRARSSPALYGNNIYASRVEIQGCERVCRVLSHP